MQNLLSHSDQESNLSFSPLLLNATRCPRPSSLARSSDGRLFRVSRLRPPDVRRGAVRPGKRGGNSQIGRVQSFRRKVPCTHDVRTF